VSNRSGGLGLGTTSVMCATFCTYWIQCLSRDAITRPLVHPIKSYTGHISMSEERTIVHHAALTQTEVRVGQTQLPNIELLT